jgi:hypothetical protein
MGQWDRLRDRLRSCPASRVSRRGDSGTALGSQRRGPRFRSEGRDRMPLSRVPASRRGDSGTAREPGPRHSARLTSWSSPPRPIPQSTARKLYPARAHRMKSGSNGRRGRVEGAEEAGPGRRRIGRRRRRRHSITSSASATRSSVQPKRLRCLEFDDKLKLRPSACCPRSPVEVETGVVFGQHVQEIMLARSFFSCMKRSRPTIDPIVCRLCKCLQGRAQGDA